ncbi:protease inhibitor I42 family protein [Methanolobus bombayensis]|uniref:protease inhibitor I42 family protein n=1 Tax=Methanolobus bombayensis TaxID=38023 RepID=UPI001AE8D46F|nr:protease inhibitor I42 family protein [Methanolobus bombayensis]
MNIRLLTVAAVVLLVCLASGCISDSNNTSSNNTTIGNNATAINVEEEQAERTDNDIGTIGTMTAIVHNFSENDSQSTVYAIAGDIITIELEENPTTGYSWKMTYSEGLKLEEDKFLEASTNVSLVGAGGSHMWIFQVIETGEQNISAIYKRPWEEIKGTEDSYEMTIEVIPESELIIDDGTVIYNNLEGGFYGIVGTQDAKYDPINLPDELRTDGTKIRFTAYPRDDMVSFHMWGKIVEIRTISPIL